MHGDRSTAYLQSLDREVLTTVCSLLDPVSLANLSCTSRELRNLACTSTLWASINSSRWQNLNTSLFTSSQLLNNPPTQENQYAAAGSAAAILGEDSQQHRPSTEQIALYANNNGWRDLQLSPVAGHVDCVRDLYFADFCVSRAAAPDSSSNCGAVGDVVYTVGKNLNMWSTGDCRQSGQLLGTIEAKDAQRICSITELAIGTVAAGCDNGVIEIYDILSDVEADVTPCTTWHANRR